MLEEGFERDPFYLGQELQDLLRELGVFYTFDSSQHHEEASPQDQTIVLLYDDLIDLINDPANHMMELLTSKEANCQDLQTLCYYIAKKYRGLREEMFAHAAEDEEDDLEEAA